MENEYLTFLSPEMANANEIKRNDCVGDLIEFDAVLGLAGAVLFTAPAKYNYLSKGGGRLTRVSSGTPGVTHEHHRVPHILADT